MLRVAGEAGTGSELMVGCLYLYQLGRQGAGPASQPYPIWVNLRDYDGLAGPEARLQRHLNRIDRYVEDHPSETPLLFAAGFDCYTHHRTALHELLADHTGGFRRIVAIDKGVHCNGFSEPAPGPIPGRASRTIRLAGLEAGTPAASRFIKGFARLTHNGVTATDLERVAAVCNFSKVDIGTASMAYAMVTLDDGNLSSGGAYFHRYLLDEYIPDCPLPAGADALARAAEYAYEYVVNGVTPPAAEQGCAAWQMVHRGEDLGRFLVAYRIAESAMRSRPTDADWEVLRRPLIQQTMYLARDLVNASKGSKTSFVKRAEVLFKTPDPDAVANMSFLLGRLEGEEARQDARRLLRRSRDAYLDQLAGLDIPGVTDKRISGLLFSLRTLYVSMIYLGDRKASDDYIGLMIDDPRWNRINRGFHLEYYGDIPIMPPDALRPGKASPFPRTYQRLTAKITSPDRQASFDLDVFTLYSLAQSCHLDGVLEEPIRKKLVRLAPKLAKEVRSDRLKLYLGVMRRHLGYESFGTGCVAEELFRVKQVLRTGWVKRKVDRPESVADHMYGAFLLAFCYLPLQDEDEGYDRDRILKLLLVHDLAESETGDIVNKSRAQQRAESRWFAEATTLSTYAELAGVGELGDLWREYEGSTINARIAKDFDRLDQLTQLYIYRSQIRDFATWRAELLGSIETEQGKRVLEALTAHFDT